MRCAINSVKRVAFFAGVYAFASGSVCLSQVPSAGYSAANPSKSDMVEGKSAAANATVKADTLAVYADMRSSSATVSSLNKGQALVVDFEFKTSAEKWCRVKLPAARARLGYVLCAGLDRKEEAPRPNLASGGLGSAASVGQQSAARPRIEHTPERSAGALSQRI